MASSKTGCLLSIQNCQTYQNNIEYTQPEQRPDTEYRSTPSRHNRRGRSSRRTFLVSDPDPDVRHRSGTMTRHSAVRTLHLGSAVMPRLCLSIGLLLCFVHVITCFNVDIRTHVLHQQNIGSMFGFTVDQYREDGQN
ncbi:hypothetical protein LSH36_839g04089 [Paralvinella palmiformis]|uniref:Uncharacterized protein n=1 Tax=Paralvinella palmiformis TaxID=53620 RepID=A0AAD9IYS8_9ANNE|nr:hypothetical protein LSH36_839g04089 [Paralvinella palmiformis]